MLLLMVAGADVGVVWDGLAEGVIAADVGVAWEAADARAPGVSWTAAQNGADTLVFSCTLCLLGGVSFASKLSCLRTPPSNGLSLRFGLTSGLLSIDCGLSCLMLGGGLL